MQLIQNLIYNIVLLIICWLIIKFIWKRGVDVKGLCMRKIENLIPSKNTQQPIMKLIIIIGIVITFIYMSRIIWINNVDVIGLCRKKIENLIPSQETAAPTDTTGILKTDEAPLFEEDVIVYVGSNRSIQSVERAGNRQFFHLHGLDIALEEGQIKISAKILSSDGKNAVQITDNEWEINPNAVFRKNFDKRGLEIIDNYGLVVLQVDMLDKQTLKIAGLFEVKGEAVCVTDRTIFPIPEVKEDFARIQEMLRRQDLMFRYPADKHFSERTERLQTELMGRDERLSKKNLAAKRKILSTLSNKDLKKQLHEQVSTIQQLISQALKVAPTSSNNPFEEFKELLGKMEELPMMQRSRAGIQEYDAQFKHDIIALYDEIAFRLGPRAKEMPRRVLLEKPPSVNFLEESLNELVNVAETLD